MPKQKQEKIRVLAIIPARAGSKRVKNKNVRRVAGKPLIQFAIEAAAAAKTVDACIVSTDSTEIAALAKKLGADVPFLRPKEFARDDSPDIEYAKHALQWVEKNRKWKPEVIVLLPPDAPLRSAKDIDGVVNFLLKENLDSVRTLSGPVRHPPFKALWVMKKGKGNRIAPLFPQFVGMPSQQLPAYFLSVSVAYATRANFVKKGTLWGPRVGGYLIEENQCVEIDEEDQLRQAELALLKRKTL